MLSRLSGRTGFIIAYLLLLAAFVGIAYHLSPIRAAYQLRQQQAAQGQGQQAAVPAITNEYKGMQVLVDAPYKVKAVAATGQWQVLGGGVVEGLGVYPILQGASGSSSLPSPRESAASVSLITSERDLNLRIYQMATRDGNLTGYAYATRLVILGDGKVLKELTVTKDTLLVQPIQLSTGGARQVTFAFSTAGRKQGNQEVDQYGAWFPVVVVAEGGN